MNEAPSPEATPARRVLKTARALLVVIIASAGVSASAYAAVAALSSPDGWVMKAVRAAVALETGMVAVYAANTPSED